MFSGNFEYIFIKNLGATIGNISTFDDADFYIFFVPFIEHSINVKNKIGAAFFLLLNGSVHRIIRHVANKFVI